MKTVLKTALVASLMLGGAQAAFAAKTQPANSAASASSGQLVPGIAVANIEAIVANSAAFKTAQTQRPVTYKAQFDAAEARRKQIAAQLQPLVEKFNRDRQAPNANTQAAQASLQDQAQTIQAIQQSGQQELQKMLEPVALSEAYVQEQINDKLNTAIQTAMTKKGVTLVVSPQSVIAANNGYNINQAILDELNAAIPSAQLVPPAGWEPREVREQKAAQAAQQAAQPARPATPGGR